MYLYINLWVHLASSVGDAFMNIASPMLSNITTQSASHLCSQCFKVFCAVYCKAMESITLNSLYSMALVWWVMSEGLGY